VLPRILPRPHPRRRRGLGEWPLHGALRWGGAERIARLMIEPAGFDRSDRMFGHAPPSRPAVHPRATVNSSRSAARFRKTRSILRMRNASDVLDSELEAGRGRLVRLPVHAQHCAALG
jgi:hypothetical protein